MNDTSKNIIADNLPGDSQNRIESTSLAAAGMSACLKQRLFEGLGALTGFESLAIFSKCFSSTVAYKVGQYAKSGLLVTPLTISLFAVKKQPHIRVNVYGGSCLSYFNSYNLITILLLSLLVLVSCKGNKEGAAPQVIPEVTVVEAVQRDVPVYAEYVGQTFGQSDVEIRSRVEGWVRSINFKEGSVVRKGQLLYVIQDDELRDREQQARAQLSQANILLVKAKSDLDRVKPLAEMNALSKRDLDAAQATYGAQAQAVVAAKAALSNARTQLSYSRITAPISGTIGISTVQVGDYVKNIAEAPLNTISAVGAMRVRFSITENDYIKYSQSIDKDTLKNLEVQFILNDGSVFPETGKLDFANREIDPATGSLLVQALVENKSKLLRPGQYVKVRFKSAEIPNAVLVPQQAINQMQSAYMAFVVNDSNKINPKPVKTGIRVGSSWVITEGIKPGDKVAIVGNAVVKPGITVKPVMTSYPDDSTSVK